MKRVIENYNYILLIIFLGGVLFCSSNSFVEKETLPKEYLFIFFSILLGGITLVTNRQPIQLDSLAIGILLFILYLILVSIFTSPAILGIFSLSGFIFLFFYFKEYNHSPQIINYFIIVLCILQAGYGLMQYFHLIHISSPFPIVGSYDNPAGFAACLAVAFPLIFPLFRYSKSHKIFALFAIAIIGGALALSESRAGVVSIVVVSVLFLYAKFSNRLKKFKKYIIPSILALGIALFAFLISLKQDSASGRLFIWQVTSEMIKDNPILGTGNGSFIANYMQYQANYFIEYPSSKYILFADNVLHPFNEYLLLIVEYGLAGFILLATCIAILFRNNSKLFSPYILCLISFSMFSMFSYPLKFPFTWIIIAYCLAQICRYIRPELTILFPNKIWFKSLIAIICVVGLFLLMQNIKFEYNWNKAAKASLLGKTKEVMPQYEKLHQTWNGNHLFLYNYGAELNHIKEFKKSIEVLYQCTQYWDDYDIQMIIAENYFHLKEWDKSEKHYFNASNMCPNRFVPLSKLMDIYEETNQMQSRDRIARDIVAKEVKIPSYTVSLIKHKASKLIK